MVSSRFCETEDNCRVVNLNKVINYLKLRLPILEECQEFIKYFDRKKG